MQEVIGPVEYIILGFPGNKFQGEILPALHHLLDEGLVRILDLAVISKDAEGNVLLLESSELPAELAEAILDLEGEHDDVLTEEDLLLAAEDMEYSTTAAAILYENVWAARFAQAIRNAEGEVLLNVRIPHSVFAEAQQSLMVID